MKDKGNEEGQILPHITTYKEANIEEDIHYVIKETLPDHGEKHELDGIGIIIQKLGGKVSILPLNKKTQVDGKKTS